MTFHHLKTPPFETTPHLRLLIILKSDATRIPLINEGARVHNAAPTVLNHQGHRENRFKPTVRGSPRILPRCGGTCGYNGPKTAGLYRETIPKAARLQNALTSSGFCRFHSGDAARLSLTTLRRNESALTTEAAVRVAGQLLRRLDGVRGCGKRRKVGCNTSKCARSSASRPRRCSPRGLSVSLRPPRKKEELIKGSVFTTAASKLRRLKRNHWKPAVWTSMTFFKFSIRQ